MRILLCQLTQVKGFFNVEQNPFPEGEVSVQTAMPNEQCLGKLWVTLKKITM